MATYKPKPLNTSKVELPASLTELLEDLAKNTHDVWAAQRIQEGWSHGPARNDVAKQHPGLVPYEKLSDSEKEYDRKTAAEALKLILKLGYKIVEPETK